MRPRERLWWACLSTAACLVPLAAKAQQAPPTANSGFATGPSQQISEPGLGPLFGPVFPSDHLFGDWGGTRTWLENHGIEVDLDNLTENLGNITGGRRETFTTSGQTALEVDLDLAKLAGIPNTAFHTMIVNGNGRNLATDSIGDDLATPQEIYGGRGNVVAHMVYAYGETTFANNRVDLTGGWLPVGTYFAASPLYCDFLNVLFCGNPHPLPNYPGEDDWPQASFGGQVRVLPTKHTYVMLGLYSVDTSYGTGGGGNSGWAWADPHKSGVSIPVELGWVPSFGPHHLIGHYKVGYDRDKHRYADVLTGTTGRPYLVDGSAPLGHDRDMVYLLADQMLLRQGSGDTDGVILFGGWVHASNDVSPLSEHAFVGLTSIGSAWGRPADTVGVAFQWIEMSGGFTRAQEIAQDLGAQQPLSLDGFGPSYGPQNTEDVVELDYQAAVYRGVTFVPDFQYLIRPGATTTIPNAAVLGFRTNINF